MFVHLGFWTRFCGSICAGQRVFDAGSRSGGGATRRVRAVCGRFSRLGGASVDVSVTFRKISKNCDISQKIVKVFSGVLLGESFSASPAVSVAVPASTDLLIISSFPLRI